MHDRILQEVKADPTAWEELEIPRDHRVALISLVQRHFYNKEASQRHSTIHDYDIIRGKGKTIGLELSSLRLDTEGEQEEALSFFCMVLQVWER